MRFLMMVIPKAYDNAAADFTPPVELVERMSRFNRSLEEAGVLLSLDGLAPPTTGARVRFQGGRTTVVEGPQIDSKERVGGFWMIRVGSQAEAIEWARRAPMLDGDMIEVRRIQEPSDFPEDVLKALGA